MSTRTKIKRLLVHAYREGAVVKRIEVKRSGTVVIVTDRSKYIYHHG